MVKRAVEANFDGLVGPTHNYAGLSWGNVASRSNVNSVANPREAALQGLAKMKRLADRGYVQGVLPPHERPHLPTLRALGFTGNEGQVLSAVARTDPALLAAVSSASAMWTANAATVSPSADTADQRVHLTPANLSAKFHRSIEHRVTGRALKAIFSDERYFAHHSALPSVSQFGDEGAANHTRLCGDYGAPGVELFVYGQEAFNDAAPAPVRFPARQTLEASRAIARLHGLTDRHAVFAQQNPAAIDAGVFHNDVIAVGNGNCLFYHEQAFLHESQVLTDLRERLTGVELAAVRVSSDQVPIADAVSSYLFNSQLLASADGMLLAVPGECREVASVSRYLDTLVQSGGPITAVEVFDVKQSMRNGGGPACLRLRVVLNEDELRAINQNVILTDALYERLTVWVKAHYRDAMSQQDLADPMLLDEVRKALDELTAILGLGSIYDFQM
ncbi:N-succinylarginine dihydrolase [Marinobacter daepoensis]|uniref:N-succinylarginine dihydrolase n=1 Tax=Marinobacter daepoensis TaxID=262077 RepID=A0ABS3BFU0_9GAMM|nr:N-succinylarginine dihydrolase [Marinobacter daepoensis]MBN7770701.1 N-succinylarginine dihydrolase [Marinobacter daepoensis]MBY6078562.1 N-succinylarginine dihydrolase [Marinobacter daepoensis]